MYMSRQGGFQMGKLRIRPPSAWHEKSGAAARPRPPYDSVIGLSARVMTARGGFALTPPCPRGTRLGRGALKRMLFHRLARAVALVGIGIAPGFGPVWGAVPMPADPDR